MFCINCGAQVSETAAFCGSCGSSLKKAPEPQLKQEEGSFAKTENPIGYGIGDTYSIEEQTVKKPKKRGFKAVYAIIAAAAVLVLAGGFFAGRFILDNMAYNNLLEKAEKAASSGDIGRAADFFREAISERPDDIQAQNMLSAALTKALEDELETAKEYVMSGNISQARSALENLPISKTDKQYAQLSEYLGALKTAPGTAYIDSSAFPSVFVSIEGGTALPEAVTIKDAGNTIAPDSVTGDGEFTVISYTAPDSPDGGESRDIQLEVAIGEFTFPLSANYVTPVPLEASVTLVSTDFSEYPTVRAFFRVEDMYSQQYVANVGPNSFTVIESVSGGAYVAREVKSAEPMVSAGSKYGINIALVADKSDSIGGDLSKIKTVMSQFVESLSLSGGDRAELIAFDDVPQLMCTFTDDAALLQNGINNMETDGMTAFYDAVYQGVRNAALQGGARCVIAFTDGGDNMSRMSEYDVIRFANEKQVPLYIIGVGYGSSHNVLRMMAEQTHGYYWYIDDLYDLTEIYAQIYSELQELYVVSYESDETADALAQRGLQVTMRGGGYKGTADTMFTPAKTAGSGSGSRYEIFMEDVSWEEANERCLERGGHLVTITSKEEEDQIIALAQAAGAKYVWLGGYTSYDSYNNVFGHWITGEIFTYDNWMTDEPSRRDKDGTPEWYLMLWDMGSAGGWCWNDQRNDLVTQFPYYSGKLSYVCEYE